MSLIIDNEPTLTAHINTIEELKDKIEELTIELDAMDLPNDLKEYLLDAYEEIFSISVEIDNTITKEISLAYLEDKNKYNNMD